MKTVTRERRTTPHVPPRHLRTQLTDRQQAALDTLEQFRWELRFVRRPLFSPPVPFVFHPDGRRYVVLEVDGTIVEEHGLRLRD